MTRIKFKAAVIIQSRGFCREQQSFHGRIFVFAQLVRQIDVFPDELQIPINGVFLLSPNLTDSISSKRLRIIPRANRSSCKSSSRASGVLGGCGADLPARCSHFDLIEQEKHHSTPLWGRYACSMFCMRRKRRTEMPDGVKDDSGMPLGAVAKRLGVEGYLQSSRR